VPPHLAALQMQIAPAARTLENNDALQWFGALAIVPMTQPLALFVWGSGRIAPVRVAALSMVEDLFSARLCPLLATVTMTLRVLSADDLELSSRGGAFYLTCLRAIEASAARLPDGRAASLGIVEAL
jgi:hypothetical protein